MVCPVCDRPVRSNRHAVECCRCRSWSHKSCSGLTTSEFDKMYNMNKKTGSHDWACRECSSGGLKRISIGGNGGADGGSASRPALSDKPKKTNTAISEVDLKGRVSCMIAGGSVDIKDVVLLLSQVVTLLLDQKEILTEVKDSCFLKIGKLETEITELRSKIVGLESSIQKAQEGQSDPSYNRDDILRESVERQRIAKNVVVFNVPESQSTEAAERIDHDKARFVSVLDALGLNTNVTFRVSRIGRNNNAQSRPMKVQFGEEAMVAKCMKNRYKLRGQNISIRPDLTLIQRTGIKKTYEELKNRQEKGEPNLTMKFKNGIPFIATGMTKRRSQNDLEDESTGL